MKLIFATITALLLSGCTTVGPFVTSATLSPDGQLTTHTCRVQFDGFFGVIRTKDCTDPAMQKKPVTQKEWSE